MPRTTKSERVATEAVQDIRNGNVKEGVTTLARYADYHVRNRRTWTIFSTALEKELELLGDGPHIRIIEQDLENDTAECGACGSHGTTTYDVMENESEAEQQRHQGKGLCPACLMVDLEEQEYLVLGEVETQ